MAFNAGSIEATLTLNRNPFTAGLAAARNQARAFARQRFTVTITPRLDQEALGRIRTTLNRTVGRVTLRPQLDREAYERIRNTLNRTVGRVTIRPNLDREAFQRIKNTIDRAVGRMTVRVVLDRDSLLRVRAQIEALNPVIRVRVEYDRDTLENLLRRFRDLNNEANRGAGAMRNFGNSGSRAFRHMDGTVRAVLISLPLLLPVLGSAITGLIGLVGALTSAFVTAGAGIAAFAGVGISVFQTINQASQSATGMSEQAISALKSVENARRGYQRAMEDAAEREIDANRRIQDAQESLTRAVESAAETRAAAAKRVEDAQEQLIRTTENVARANARAAEQVAAAERNVISVQKRARDAQEDLNRARKDAVESLEDLKLALRGGALSEEQAILDLEEAQLAFNAALAAGTGGLELRQLELDVRQAALAVDEAKERYIDLQEESAEWARTGIEGSEGVRNAQDRLTEANEAVQEAERDVARARADATQVALDGQRDIQDAQEEVAEARADQVRAELDAQRQVQDAERRVADAREEAARVYRDNQRSIEDAQRQLTDAQEAFAKATEGTSVRLTASMQRAADALREVRAQYDALVARTQDNVADAFTANFRAAAQFLKTLDPLVKSTAEAFEQIGRMAEDYFGSEHWKNFVDLISAQMVPTLTNMFEIVAYLVRAIMNLTIAFQPMADWLLESIVQGMKDFAEWTATLAGDPRFQEWVETAKEALKRFWDFLVSVVEFLFWFSYAMSPLGSAIFGVLSDIFKGLSQMPPEWLNGIAIGLGAIFGALLLGSGGPMAIVIGVIAGVAAALGTLYANNENVRTSVDNFVSTMRDRFLPIWENMVTNFEEKVIPAWESAVDAMEEHLLPVLEDLAKQIDEKVIPAIEDLADTFTEKLLPDILDFWAAIQPFVAWLVSTFGGEVVDTFEALVRIIDGAFQMISGILKTFTGIFTGDWEKFGEGLKGISEGFWTIIAAIFGMSLDELKATFAEWDRNMANAWNGFWGGIITEQDGSQREVNGSWNDFWDGVGNYLSEETRQMNNDWVEYWGGMITEQDGSQTYVEGEWNAFWGRVSQAAYDFEVMMDNNWANFWGGVITEQDGSQRTVEGSWNTFWGDVAQWASDTWNNITTGWNNFWSGLWTIIQQGVNNVGAEFRRIGNLFREPINWVINVVLNDGVLNAWNTVMGWIGGQVLQVGRIPSIPAFAEGGKVTGGVANRDSVHAMLMPGEYVFSKRAIENMGGLGAVDQMHKAARMGTTVGNGSGRNDGLARQALMRTVPYMDDGRIRQFAYGGVQPHVAIAGQEIERIFGRMPGGIGGVGARANASDHPSGYALDFMTMSNKDLGDRVTAHLMAHAQRLAVKYLIWQQAINSGTSSGWRPMEDRGSPTANHYDHVHASFQRAGLRGVAMGGGLPAGGGNYFTDMWSIFGSQAVALFNRLLQFTQMPGIGSPIGNSATQIPTKIVDKVIEQLQKKLTGMITSIFTGPGKNVGTAPPKAGVFDRGGMLYPGINPVSYASGPERVLPPHTTESFDRLVEILEALVGNEGVLTNNTAGGDTYNIVLPAGASVKELADRIGFSKRVNMKGRYPVR